MNQKAKGINLTSEGYKIEGWHFDNKNGKQFVFIDKFGKCEFDKYLNVFLTNNDKGEDEAHVL
jgi:hypothetical protein